MDVPRKYQTFWPRFWAGWIDELVFAPVWFIDSWVEDATAAPLILAIWYVLYTLSFDIYSVAMHAKYGQTLGKMLMGVRVLDLSETKLSLRQAVLRDIVPIIFSSLTVASALPRIFGGLDPYKTGGEFNWIDYAWLYGSLIWFLVELGTMLTNAKRRALHDLIARSVVVRVSYFEAEAKSGATAA